MIVLAILLKMPHTQFLFLKHYYSPAFIFYCSICQETGTCISGGQRRKDPVSCGPCWPDCGVKMVQERTRDPPYSKVCHLLFLHVLFYNYIQKDAHMKPTPTCLKTLHLLCSLDCWSQGMQKYTLRTCYTHTRKWTICISYPANTQRS